MARTAVSPWPRGCVQTAGTGLVVRTESLALTQVLAEGFNLGPSRKAQTAGPVFPCAPASSWPAITLDARTPDRVSLTAMTVSPPSLS